MQGEYDLKGLSRRLILVKLSIKAWGASRSDRAIGQKVDREAQVKRRTVSASRTIMRSDALDGYKQAASVFKTYHDERTLPWDDSGYRALPAKMFPEYIDGSKMYQDMLKRAVRNIVENWDSDVAAQKQAMGSLFKPGDYPAKNEIAGRFGYHLGFKRVDAVADWRVDLPEEYQQMVVSSARADALESVTRAHKALLKELIEVFGGLSDVLGDMGATLYESRLQKAHRLVGLLPTLNITGDKEIADLCGQLKKVLSGAPTIDVLRNNGPARTGLSAELRAILDQADSLREVAA